MKRKDFLKISGLTGLGIGLINSKSIAETLDPSIEKAQPEACVLIPSETAGPFPLDLTENNYYFRKDVRETQIGVEHRLKLKIIGNQNCAPLQNVRVNIWHCTKDGLYSGYDNSMNKGQAGLTYLRGYQFTDSNGEVEFVTVFPGWYSGRICHIHFQVYVSSNYAAISQLTYDLDKKNAVYASNPSIYTKGADPLSYTQDNIFSDGYQYQIASLSLNPNDKAYESFLEVTVKGSGATATGNLEKETAKYFKMDQNYPNPVESETAIPFVTFKTGSVVIDLYDMQGKKCYSFDRGILMAGIYKQNIDFNFLGLSSQSYAYQLNFISPDGSRFTDVKMLTVISK